MPTNQQTIEQVADELGIDMGKMLYMLIRYLTSDPRYVSPQLRRALLDTSNEDIEEALETIVDDYKDRKQELAEA